MTKEERISDIVSNQREFFNTGITRNYQTRIECLRKLKSGLEKYEADIHAALKKDLGKPEFESYLTETGFCKLEIGETMRKLGKWMRPRRTPTSLLAQPGISTVHYTPLGVNLIISPYNYPVNLTFSPLTAAIAAGNTAVVKTSELTPACGEVIRQLAADCLDPEYVAYVPGEVEETTLLLAQKFDHIFFTGSARVGSIVMGAAAKHLTPVTLELGGKSPCIVHHDANLDVAAKRIVRGKYLNAGQTCVAPDFVFVHKNIQETFLDKLKRQITASYGEDPSASPDYGRIVNDAHFERISGLIDSDKVVVGGQTDAASRYIAPTVMRDITENDMAMREEIFGPVLPVLSYEDFVEIYSVVNNLPRHPLACYIFSQTRHIQRELVARIQFGGGCVNNCVMHIANSHLPFGGVGESGMGSYHGFHGFKRFSHSKSVMKTPTRIDIPLLYAPYKDKIKLIRRIMK